MALLAIVHVPAVCGLQRTLEAQKHAKRLRHQLCFRTSIPVVVRVQCAPGDPLHKCNSLATARAWVSLVGRFLRWSPASLFRERILHCSFTLKLVGARCLPLRCFDTAASLKARTQRFRSQDCLHQSTSIGSDASRHTHGSASFHDGHALWLATAEAHHRREVWCCTMPHAALPSRPNRVAQGHSPLGY